MNDKKERVYSEQDLCEYTILQKIDELERQLQNIKNEFNGLYETKEDANNSHTTLSDNIASVDNDLQMDINENARRIRDIATAVNNMNNIIPNDIGVKDNKLGLKNGNTWLTNLNAINLGSNMTYDADTNTLNSVGGGATLPAGTKDDPFIINNNKILYADNETTPNIYFAKRYDSPMIGFALGSELKIEYNNNSFSSPNIILNNNNKHGGYLEFDIVGSSNKNKYIYVRSDNNNTFFYIPALADPTTDGTYNLQIIKSGNSCHYEWVKVN